MAKRGLLGAAAAALGAAEALAALAVGHGFGIAVGVASATGGAALLATTRLPRRAARLVVGFAWASGALLLVRAASRDPARPARFPESCAAKPQGCARVAATASHRSGGLAPLRLDTTVAAAKGAALNWISAQPRAKVLDDLRLLDGEALLHARFVSRLWGFSDDLWVRVTCAEGGAALVEVQGSLRLGVGDMGVNPARCAALLEALRAAGGGLPAGGCGGGG
ncbi:hypothetical protein HT031_003446 [Scenedesmus sp. PABB004]|nr:hypothetical protein HT031_003446 [Scenedesmus sp. PABB004]